MTAASARPVWLEKPKLGASAIKAIVLVVICASILLPLVVVVSTSVADDQQIAKAGGFVLWPTHPTVEAYATLFRGPFMFQALGVSAFVTVIGTLLALFVTITLAYATSRPVLLGRPVTMMVLFTLLFAPGIIPVFLVVRQLHMLDTIWSLIIPTAFTAFNFVVMRSFFMNIPGELVEAARMDGASDVTILWRIVLPLSKAVIAVVGLFYAVGFWNAFFNAQLYIQRRTDLLPVQVILRQYVVSGQSLTADQLGIQHVPPPQSLQMAIVMVALVPILIVYPFLQRHFNKGVITGAIKG